MITNLIPSKSVPMAIVIGVFVVFAVIEIAKLGYNFGVWLKNF